MAKKAPGRVEPTSLWENDKIQFARLLCEIRANIVGTEKEWDDLCLSMDLSHYTVESLFDRAEKVFEESKKKVFREARA